MKLICLACVFIFSVAYGQTPLVKGTSYDSKKLIQVPNADWHEMFPDSLCLVSKGNKFGIIDSRGNEVVPLIYDVIDIDFNIRKSINHQLKTINEYFYYYWMDYEDEEIYNQLLEIELSKPNSYLNLSSKFNSNPVFAAKKGNQWGVIDKSNEIIIPFQYDFLKDIGQDIFLVNSNGKHGIINDKNEVIVPITCDDIIVLPYFSELIYNHLKYSELTGPGSFALLKKENKFGIINLFTHVVIPPRYDSLEMCFPVPEYDCMCGFSNKEIWTLNTLHPSQSVHSFQNVLKFKVGDKLGLLNTVTMEEIAPPVYDSIDFEGETIVKLNGRSFLLINQNTELNPDSYDEIHPVHMYQSGGDFSLSKITFQIVKSGGKYGLVNEIGEPLSKIEWDTIISCVRLKDTTTYEFIVQRKGKLGVVNSHNQIVLPIKYDSISLHEEMESNYRYIYHYILSRRGKPKKVIIDD